VELKKTMSSINAFTVIKCEVSMETTSSAKITLKKPLWLGVNRWQSQISLNITVRNILGFSSKNTGRGNHTEDGCLMMQIFKITQTKFRLKGLGQSQGLFIVQTIT
jgi:hypothetical protein